MIHDFYEEQLLDYNYLPEMLCFVEFKSVKSAESKMSFVFCDGKNGRLIDIVKDRRLSTLKPYFMRFSQAARTAMTHVVIDLYAPYLTLIKEVFPNAEIILDKFHAVQLLSRALNKTHIRITNQNKEFYSKFKTYWRLLLMAKEKLNILEFNYSRCLKKRISSYKIVEFLLSIDPKLKATYDFYRDILYAIKHPNLNVFNNAIHHASESP